MKQEINYSRYVDRYLDGVMSASEKLWFEKEIDSNVELQSEIDLQKKINHVISDKDILDLQSRLDVIYRKTYHPWKETINFAKLKAKPVYILSGIAVILLLAFSLVASFMYGKKTTSEALYAEYYKRAEINMNLRTAEDIVDSELRSAMVLYDNKDYEKAIVLFEKIIEKDNTRIGLNLYSGISRMEIKQYDEANRNFNKIIDHKANAFIESAQWYLGLCYLMTSENQKAKEVFYRIAKSDGYYKKDARRILKKIK